MHRTIRKAMDAVRPLLVSPSLWMDRLAKQSYPDLPRRVIPNGVEWPLGRVSKSRAKRALGIHPQGRVVLFAAHGGEQSQLKGGDRWRWLWKKIRSETPDTIGIFVGGNRVKREERLLLFPYVEGEVLDLIYESADILAYPTRADNHSLVVLEAMARGVCPVCFAVGGVPEQVGHLKTGLLVEPGDWSGMAETLLMLIRNRELTGRMGRTAHSEGRVRFSSERMYREYALLYGELRPASIPGHQQSSRKGLTP